MVVEVVDLVPGSIPERVQYANVDDWRMDCPWWLVLTVIPAIRFLQEGLEPNGCGRSMVYQTKHKGRGVVNFFSWAVVGAIASRELWNIDFAGRKAFQPLIKTLPHEMAFELKTRHERSPSTN